MNSGFSWIVNGKTYFELLQIIVNLASYLLIIESLKLFQFQIVNSPSPQKPKWYTGWKKQFKTCVVVINTN